MTNSAIPPDPLPHAGIKAEDLIGWRVWRVKAGHLWSYSADYAWMPGEVSEGEPGDHDHAGIWAFRDKRRAFQKALESGPGFVWGSVRLWGQVVEHKDGFRASKARVVSIGGGVRPTTEEFNELCAWYGVPANGRQVSGPKPDSLAEVSEIVLRRAADRIFPPHWSVRMAYALPMVALAAFILGFWLTR